MLKIVNKKTISFTINGDFLRLFPRSSSILKDILVRTLNKQGDFYFGKDNWYAEKIYTRQDGDAITYLMDVIGDEEEQEFLKKINNESQKTHQHPH